MCFLLRIDQEEEFLICHSTRSLIADIVCVCARVMFVMKVCSSLRSLSVQLLFGLVDIAPNEKKEHCTITTGLWEYFAIEFGSIQPGCWQTLHDAEHTHTHVR
jgi:hypothetical protein